MVKITVPRRISNDIENNPSWSLLFGRRKVGKTFLVENFVPHDVYFSVRIDRSVSARGFIVSEITDLTVFTNSVKDLLKNEKTVVIDEFQRLPMRVLEDIALMHPNGRLILTGSSFRIAHQLIDKRSPLLGLLKPFKVNLISPIELLRSITPVIGAENAVAFAPLLMDPWTIPFYTGNRFLKDITSMLHYVVPGLIGEIFTSEERGLTKTYASILALIGAGYSDYREIANILHARKIIKTNSSSNVIPYMNNMVDMGILERVRRFKKNTFVYSIQSFPIHLYWYLESRYSISQRECSWSELRPTAQSQLRFGIERFIAEFFCELLGGTKEFLREPDREIDILISKRNKTILVGEVKWGKVGRKDINGFGKNVKDFSCRKVFVTRKPIDIDSDSESDGIEIITPRELCDLATSNQDLEPKGEI